MTVSVTMMEKARMDACASMVGLDMIVEQVMRGTSFRVDLILSLIELCGPHGLICHNGGVCLRHSESIYTCQCEHPWLGPMCQERK